MFRKTTVVFLMATMVLFGCQGFAKEADAAIDCVPTMKITDTGETSVKLKITCLGLEKTKVRMKILVSNDDTEKDSYKKAVATLGKDGSVTLKISGLDSATNYTFKVKLKKYAGHAYSSYSSGANTTTKGSDYEPEIKKINGITEDSVRLNIACDDLENDDVTVQVAYKKKTSWSTETFSLTLDDDGEGRITMDDLKSDTAYSFKIRIKKSDDSSYSAYSSIETATTDDN